MKWQQLFSNKRFGSHNLKSADETRGEYLRDYDRLIFSSQFRRLQNKTQVFPLPGSIFVHNRLTHSLEVASVGRSLGRAVGEKIAEKYSSDFTPEATDFYRFGLADVVQTACIAHDIGNPPFGHAGENAIRLFFSGLPPEPKQRLRNELTDNQLTDFTHFEGNANAFRVLSSVFIQSGLKLTYTTLASIVKYPVKSAFGFQGKNGSLSKKKSGYFDAELDFVQEMANELGIIALNIEQMHFARHPFVFLVEAADDICYRIIDLEDAFRLRILGLEEIKSLLLPFFDHESSRQYLHEQMTTDKDPQQKLSLLRAMLINHLTKKCTEAFIASEHALLNGTLDKPLIDLLDEDTINLIKKIDTVSVDKIYNHRSVLEVEIAGYHVIGGLLNEFVGAVLEPANLKSKQLLKLLPPQFAFDPAKNLYFNLLSITDFISGMTDNYAIDLFRKITGIQIPSIG